MTSTIPSDSFATLSLSRVSDGLDHRAIKFRTVAHHANKHPNIIDYEVKLLSSSQLAEFLTFVKQVPNSELPLLVKKLTINVGTSGEPGVDEEGGDEDDEIAATINQLLCPKLLSGLDDLTVIIRSRKLSGQIPLVGLGKCIVSGHLSTLALSNVVLPHSVLMHAFQNIKNLSLSNMGCFNMAGASHHKFPPLRTCKLETLELGDNVNQCVVDFFLFEPQPLTRFKNLQRIFFVNERCLQAKWRFAMTLSKTLNESLTISIDKLDDYTSRRTGSKRKRVEDLGDVRKVPESRKRLHRPLPVYKN